jgi:hypothetical protein
MISGRVPNATRMRICSSFSGVICCSGFLDDFLDDFLGVITERPP